MPDLSWNKSCWDGEYNWRRHGEEWSDSWGGSEAQWFGSIFPRLHGLLPAEKILEIAPGHGRWTRFLVPSATVAYDGVDLSEECVGFCREAFASAGHARFFCNDGTSLNMLDDHSYDLIFSFDSLVHVELDVHAKYVPAILRRLRAGGVAFIHHSNWASAGDQVPNIHRRGESVSAEAYASLVEASGGVVLLQECINWGGAALIDAFSVFARGGSGPFRGKQQIQNFRFMMEAEIVREVHSRYCRDVLLAAG